MARNVAQAGASLKAGTPSSLQTNVCTITRSCCSNHR
uniref:Uncharacterized protein n=1 Tax=Arundo donax TaxID=35708 RepID=A0A0A9C1V2_ARUDO